MAQEPQCPICKYAYSSWPRCERPDCHDGHMAPEGSMRPASRMPPASREHPDDDNVFRGVYYGCLTEIFAIVVVVLAYLLLRR